MDDSIGEMGYELIWSKSINRTDNIAIPKGTKLYPYTQFMVEVTAKSGFTLNNTNNYGGTISVTSYNPFSSSATTTYIVVSSSNEGVYRLNKNFTSKVVLNDYKMYNLLNNKITVFIGGASLTLDSNGKTEVDTEAFVVKNGNYHYSSFTGTFEIKLYGNKI